jgi:hypothetical protein
LLAFLKRRWILLSCAVALLACSVIDIKTDFYATLYGYRAAEIDVVAQSFGLYDGCFLYFRDEDTHRTLSKNDLLCQRRVRGVHTCRVGKSLVYKRGAGTVNFSLPIWLPLAAAIGWLVFRELRWRERRAKPEHSDLKYSC